MTGVHTKSGNLETNKCTERMPYEHEDRHLQVKKRDPGQTLPSQSSEGTSPADTLGLLASRIVRQPISAV